MSSWRKAASSAPEAPAAAWHPDDFRAPAPAPADATPHDPVADAFLEGYIAGQAEGAKAERERLATAMRALDEVLSGVAASSAAWSAALEDNIAALAVATARHIVDHELTTDPAVTARIVAKALAEFPVDDELQIRVNPGDLATVQQSATEHGGPVAPKAARARWVADARIVPGGCVIEGRDRIIDGRVDTALERVYRRLSYRHA